MLRGESEGPGITEVSFNTPDGKLAISRPDGRNATLRLARPGPNAGWRCTAAIPTT